jgi:membrane protease YdiL (CAAX protease family)
LDVFHTLAEIAVAITGFSSLIIIFRGNSTDWNREDYLGFSYVLSWSIGTIFLSLLPIILVAFGLELPAAARIGLFSALGYIFIVAVALGFTRKKTIPRKDGKSRSFAGSLVGPGGVGLAMSLSAFTVVTVALTASLGWLPGPSQGWYATTIVLLMAHAIAEMGIFILLGTRQNASERA